MDWLEVLTAKRLALALAVCAALRFGLPYWRYPYSWYMDWRYPPQGGPSRAGDDILADTERREAAEVEGRYRRVLAELQQADADGFDTSVLRAKAQEAMTLNTKEYRRTAVRLLTEVEMAVPRKKVQYIPMGPTEAPGEDIVPDAPAKPVEQVPPAKNGRAAKKRRWRRAR